MASCIFISYRRTDAAGWAGRIADKLRSQIGSGSVFLDVSSIQYGSDFLRQIRSVLDRTSLMIVLIGPNWAGPPDDSQKGIGLSDFVRLEIQEAKRRQIPLLPILLDGASMPERGDLGRDLEFLLTANAISIQADTWEAGCDRISLAVGAALGRGLSSRAFSPMYFVRSMPGRVVLALLAVAYIISANGIATDLPGDDGASIASPAGRFRILFLMVPIGVLSLWRWWIAEREQRIIRESLYFSGAVFCLCFSITSLFSTFIGTSLVIDALSTAAIITSLTVLPTAMTARAWPKAGYFQRGVHAAWMLVIGAIVVISVIETAPEISGAINSGAVKKGGSDRTTVYVRIPSGLAARHTDDPQAFAGTGSRVFAAVEVAEFLMMRTEVPRWLYRDIIGEVPRSDCEVVGEGDDLPVSCITWLEAAEFANRLSEQGNLVPVYEIRGTAVRRIPDATGFRLPTELQWEYASRAGVVTTYVGTDRPSEVCSLGNVADASSYLQNVFPCSDGFPELAPVCVERFTNRWGLCGMGGNVSEWVDRPARDFVSDRYIAKGASWLLHPEDSKISTRIQYPTTERRPDIGFRLVLPVARNGTDNIELALP